MSEVLGYLRIPSVVVPYFIFTLLSGYRQLLLELQYFFVAVFFMVD